MNGSFTLHWRFDVPAWETIDVWMAGFSARFAVPCHMQSRDTQRGLVVPCRQIPDNLCFLLIWTLEVLMMPALFSHWNSFG